VKFFTSAGILSFGAATCGFTTASADTATDAFAVFVA
jgi:hypothetical protein